MKNEAGGREARSVGWISAVKKLRQVLNLRM
jgi:hypothetical protein